MALPRGLLRVLLLVAFVCAGELARAEDLAAEDARQAIQSATLKFVEAFNDGDTATMKSLWAPDADLITDDGRRIFFQDRITAAQTAADSAAAMAATQGISRPQRRTDLTMTINTIRFITPQVASVDGVTIYKSSRQATPEHSRFTTVWVLRGNQWLIDSVRENAIAASAHRMHLTELAWMAGEWNDGGENPRLRTRFRWNADGNYLERDFQGHLPGRGEHAGVERIGWDALAGTFRSWTFNHNGGFSQALWAGLEGGWMLQGSGVTADGKRKADQVRIMKIDANTMEWTFENGTIDGQTTPDFKIRLFRVNTSPALRS